MCLNNAYKQWVVSMIGDAVVCVRVPQVLLCMCGMISDCDGRNGNDIKPLARGGQSS